LMHAKQQFVINNIIVLLYISHIQL